MGDFELGDTDWGKLARGKTLGKRVVANFSAATSVNDARGPFIDGLELKAGRSSDLHALPLNLTLSPPQVLYPIPPIGYPRNLQDAGGGQDNVAIAELGDPTAQPTFANPVALVEWGIGGIANFVKCDVLNGLCINLSTSYLRVSFGIETPRVNGTDTSLSTMAYTLSAFVGPGQPKDLGAQYTLGTGIVLDGAESRCIAIPRYAKKVYVICGTDTAGIIPLTELRFYRQIQAGSPPTGVGVAGTLVFAATNPSSGVIPSGAYYFTVVNNTGASVRPQVVFDLAI